jgi:hypothetical protein
LGETLAHFPVSFIMNTINLPRQALEKCQKRRNDIETTERCPQVLDVLTTKDAMVIPGEKQAGACSLLMADAAANISTSPPTFDCKREFYCRTTCL